LPWQFVARATVSLSSLKAIFPKAQTSLTEVGPNVTSELEFKAGMHTIVSLIKFKDELSLYIVMGLPWCSDAKK
jgi:hypothetical protein